MSTAAIGYVRVSTTEQADSGVSLDAQAAAIKSYCAMRGLSLNGLIVDPGVSAGKPLAAREGGAKLLAAVSSSRAQAVVAYKLDRLFRDAADCLQVTRTWDRENVALHLIDMGGQSIDSSTAMGRFFLTVIAGAAEMERNLIRERTSAAMQYMISKGQYIGGGVPFGYCVSPDAEALVLIPREQEVIRLARHHRGQGASLRAISDQLARQGFLSRSGRKFSASQIQRMIERSEESLAAEIAQPHLQALKPHIDQTPTTAT